ncbi:MAG: carbohydrate ABC transporter permease [Vulcanimicrobiota bacterium]
MKKSLTYSFLLFYLFLTAGPFLWLGLTSLKPSQEIFLSPFGWPRDPGLGNYARAWTVGHFGAYFGNSLAVTVLTVLATIALSAPAAYALARFRFRGVSALSFFFLSGLMIPIHLAVVPLFFQMKWLGLLNSRSGLFLVYLATSLPFAIFLLMGFFRSLPESLREAAVLDGASEWKAFWKVIFPLARPGVATVAIITFLGVWNEYLVAFTLLSGQGGDSVRTLPLGLANLTIVGQFRTDFGMVFAGVVIVMLPTLIAYVSLEKALTRGLTAGAVKE